VRAAPIAHRRTLVYSRTPDRQVFMIDGRTVDEDRIDQTVKLGDTEVPTSNITAFTSIRRRFS
jgi:hypothetical protein